MKKKKKKNKKKKKKKKNGVITKWSNHLDVWKELMASEEKKGAVALVCSAARKRHEGKKATENGRQDKRILCSPDHEIERKETLTEGFQTCLVAKILQVALEIRQTKGYEAGTRGF